MVERTPGEVTGERAVCVLDVAEDGTHVATVGQVAVGRTKPYAPPMAQRELHDFYFKEAKREGYCSRAAYKLIEIDDRRKILGKGDRVLDCGAAPGSWLQVASQRVGSRGVVVGVDLTPIRPPDRGGNVRVVTGDLREIPSEALLAQAFGASPPPGARFDVILSDMAPSTTGDRTIDHHQSARLAGAALERCPDLLARGGHLVVKVLEGEAYPDLLSACRAAFDTVKGFKPKASRSASTEMYIVAKGFRGQPDAA